MFLVFYDAWINGTRFVKAVIARNHEDRGCAFVIVGDVWAWNILAESSINVDIETTHSKKQIENLDYWIGLVKNKVTRAYCSVDDPVSKTKS